MNLIRDYVAKLSDAEKVELIDGLIRLETEGQLGDHALRRHGKAIIAELGAGSHSIVMFMERLAMEAYREFANRYLKEHGL